MKAPLCVSILVVFSFINCILFAADGRPPASGIGSDDSTTNVTPHDQTPGSPSEFIIPGPQRAFLRLAGISQKVTPEEVLPLLSRNIFTQGFEGSSHPTEFLVLLRRYVVQARELAELAANTGMVIRVTNCEDARPLLEILGYRVRGNCGEPETSLQTVDPERAFLAIDSGFPLPQLEQTLQGGKPFEYPFSSSPVPVIFAESDWTKASARNHKEDSRDLLETLLYDPALSRLYWALSRTDLETAKFLQHSIGLEKLVPYGAVLDFYGREICLREGRIIVPGGPAAESAWKDLVGASPTSPAAFVSKLVARDKGWLAAYFDVLSRVSGDRQAYFTDPNRLRLFYKGLYGVDASASATKGAFRPAPAVLLLATRLQFESNGEPLVPGGVELWREIFSQGSDAKLVRKWAKQSSAPASPDQLVQMLFALSRAPADDGPLQTYIALSEIDSRRPAGQRLESATVRLLARKFKDFSDQYRIYSEFPELNDRSMGAFLEVAQSLNSIPMSARGNAFGIFQANVGIWQILARQGQIARSQLNDSWQQLIKPFASIRSDSQVYDAGRNSLAALFMFSTGKAKGSQDEIIDLLAGPKQNSPDGEQMHRELTARIRSVLDDQRLVSLDTIQTVGDALAQKARGKQPEEYVILLAGQTREFEMPRPIFTNGEHIEWAAGLYNNHHTDVQMKTDLPRVLKSPTASHAQIDEARGRLAFFLRDTLVGLNYAYYEPPGAQALHNNPLFVRSHDFAGETVGGIKTLWQAPQLIGEGSPAGGGAHFVGSLADLPYALAFLEQDFIAPENVQALIWRELTPQLLTSAVLPRWWDVSRQELHAVALHQRMGEELLTAAATDEALRSKVMMILANRLLPKWSKQIEDGLRADHPEEVISWLMPADTFYLSAEFLRRYPDHAGDLGTATQELHDLIRQHPEQVNWNRLSHDFGIPHPSMAQNYGSELLNMAPMPPFSGNSSRFLGESWDSPNLYWARLADEAGYSPVMLNHLAPQLTRVMVEKIFATDFEDWPALLRAMHEAGAEFRNKSVTTPAITAAGRP